jgi:hypothetical protein
MVDGSRRGGMKEPGSKKKVGVHPGSTAARKERGNKQARQKLVPDSKSKGK